MCVCVCVGGGGGGGGDCDAHTCSHLVSLIFQMQQD